MRRLALTAVLLVLPSLTSAQSHPCDQPQLSTQTIASGAPHRLQWCSPGSAVIEALLVIVDAVPFDLLPITAKTGPSATGLVLYESPLFLQVEPGAHVLTAAVYNRDAATGQLQLGAPSDPFPFSAVAATPLPTAPLIIGVTR